MVFLLIIYNLCYNFLNSPVTLKATKTILFSLLYVTMKRLLECYECQRKVSEQRQSSAEGKEDIADSVIEESKSKY